VFFLKAASISRSLWATTILADPASRQKLIAMGLEPAGGSPQDLARHLDAEIRKWGEVVKFSGAKID
jgi:tripartite-type tricarboxylate transporter receptor subunit TctC